MAGNFIKGGLVKVVDSNKVVIDSNEIIKKRLEELKNKMTEMEEASEENALDEFSEGIDPVQVAMLVGDEEDEEGAGPDDGSGFSEGLTFGDAVGGNILHSSNSPEARAGAIISDATREAEEIKTKAQEEGYNDGYNKGHDAGYNEGFSKGLADAEAKVSQEYNQKYNALHAEIQAKEDELNSSFEKMVEDLEPMLVEKIMDVIKHVTSIDLSGNKEIIVSILKSALENMENGRHYLIHVSAADYDNVKHSKEDISKGTGIQEDAFEIIEDNSVPPNGALIESDAGIFDCGLGSQLELLKKQLLLLSFE